MYGWKRAKEWKEREGITLGFWKRRWLVWFGCVVVAGVGEASFPLLHHHHCQCIGSEEGERKRSRLSLSGCPSLLLLLLLLPLSLCWCRMINGFLLVRGGILGVFRACSSEQPGKTARRERERGHREEDEEDEVGLLCRRRRRRRTHTHRVPPLLVPMC